MKIYNNPVIFYFTKRILALIMILSILIALSSIYLLTKEYEIVKITVFNLDYKAQYTIVDEKLLKEFQAALDSEIISPAQKIKTNNKFVLRVERTIGTKEYTIVRKGLIYDNKDRVFRKLNKSLEKEMNKILIKLEELSPFGRLVSWEDIDNYFPRYSKATIRDLETGLSFGVQRRAGSKHSDVQPLTKEDTAIFKKIYDGTWSWRRRAVVVEVNDQKIAASMNGMPHGSGAIAKNDFSGHFCVHFLDSRVHTSNKVDPAHQAMVWKSAGKFDEYVSNLSAKEFPNLFFTLLDQKDKGLINYVLVENEKQTEALLEDLSRAKLETNQIIVDQKQLKIYQGKVKFINLEQQEKVLNYTVKLVPNKDYKGWLIKSVILF